ncbi:S41 family peptidase [Desertivirga brevis]|uniref:S41 family peptidase n=1 Tax=Desertivirga brevis TaxID=2810310 RepID=UPI001A958761|nr:S41 family peptidase [Pedobacter sp. SYSU D00873]
MASIFLACKSVQDYNEQFYEERSPKQMRSEVDFVHSKLTKYHPQLYRFISKEALDYKFDSVKASIENPLPANQFYLKLSPLVAAVRQGHATLSIPYVVEKKEEESIKQLGYRPWFPFKADFINERFFILKDSRKIAKVKPGTEIVSINGVSPKEIFRRYLNGVSRDGYNETFLPKKFTSILYYYLKEQNQDRPIKYKFSFKDSVWNYSLDKEGRSLDVVIPKSKTDTIAKKKSSISKAKENKDQNVLTSRSKAKTLRFYKGDSSVAVMRVSNFRKDAYRSFYKKSFELISRAKTKTLVIDLRDNPGGYAKDAADLYSYLIDSSVRFNRSLELTSRASLLNNYRFMSKVKPPFAKPFVSAMATVAAIPPTLTMKKEGESVYSYSESSSKNLRLKSKHFAGKVYVLINGGTFSAASLLSANLKGSGRAVFVGTETGGAQNGCVAGFLPVYTLPYSKLSLRFGLAAVEPYYATGKEGRGIFPDIEVLPTLQDRLKGVDPELSRVVEEVRGK